MVTCLFKCYTCFLVFEDADVKEEKCPFCGEFVKEMCKRDHTHCHHAVVTSIAFCPDCGAGMCPECESHDVVQISRITGYMQDVDGFNAAKKQELKDRVHHNMDGEIVRTGSNNYT